MTKVVLQFSVAAPSRGTPSKAAPVVLQQDRWDDFGFKTQYHVYYFDVEGDAFIGNVKILRKGQTISSSSELPVGPLAPLSDEFCSLGQSLDYYERLANLPREVRDEILRFLRDSLAFPEHAAGFTGEEGWRVSVTRDLDIPNYVPLARTLLERDYSALPSMELKLTFEMAGWSAPLVLDFDASNAQGGGEYRDGGYVSFAKLPERVAVVTGRNGSGKSTLLARLARVLYASQAERRRELMMRLGTIDPVGIGFSRIITVAYSAFDTFDVPGTNPEDRRQIISDLRQGSGRYVFAGLRDIGRELEERLDEDGRDIDEADDSEPIDLFSLDRLKRTYLKSADQLADEYVRTIKRIVDQDREPLLRRALDIILRDPSFSEADQSVVAPLESDARETFMGWSTGHKIVMHIVATLVAYSQPKAIVLMDEPESHLHPPLLAALMHAVRVILDKQDAFAVIATHSPVVAQETLGKHVFRINRSEGVVTIIPAQIETYGESIGEITNEVFGLTAGVADFHATLRNMVVEQRLSVEQINARFDNKMSLQARAYVMSLISSREE